jgi:cytoplasmic iron level regulating protein YaaA (DUF328/UPF0246 family)
MKGFSAGGYRYEADASDDSMMVFMRHHPEN